MLNFTLSFLAIVGFAHSTPTDEEIVGYNIWNATEVLIAEKTAYRFSDSSTADSNHAFTTQEMRDVYFFRALECEKADDIMSAIAYWQRIVRIEEEMSLNRNNIQHLFYHIMHLCDLYHKKADYLHEVACWENIVWKGHGLIIWKMVEFIPESEKEKILAKYERALDKRSKSDTFIMRGYVPLDEIEWT